MALYDNRSLILEPGIKLRPQRGLGPLGKRLAAMLLGTDGLSSHDRQDEVPEPLSDEAPASLEHLHPRFALVRRGYDRKAVDTHLAELEHELATLDQELAGVRRGDVVADEVAREIKRVGEQTSAVLMAAHHQRDEILRRAREDADRCIAEATATADLLTARCEQRLRALNSENEAAEAERARLLGDLRRISAALAAVADSADNRVVASAVDA